MKNIKEMSLSDLVSGMDYLVKYEENLIELSNAFNENSDEIEDSRKMVYDNINLANKIASKYNSEIRSRIFTKAENESIERVMNKMSDSESIKYIIKTAFEVGGIPKGKILMGKFYHKLKKEPFLKKLVVEIEKMLNFNKYGYSNEKRNILEKLFSHYSDLLLQIVKEEPKHNKVNETKFNENTHFEDNGNYEFNPDNIELD